MELVSGLRKEFSIGDYLQMKDEAGEDFGQILNGSGSHSEDLGAAQSRSRNSSESLGESLLKVDIAPTVLRTLPSDFVKRHRILPIRIRNGTLHVATSDPGNQRVIDDIRLLTGLEVEESMVPASGLLERIAECYRVTVEQMLENLDPEHGPAADGGNLHDIEVMANEPTVINLVNVIISTALKERASDIHLVPFEQSLQLRYRIDGLLQEKPPPPKNLHAALVSSVVSFK
ncbi:MAG: hypothetical protein O2960_00850 [Verrucomicrobia bacterium]|nr:hypothetical protein [Verrucomicrobiota bacterium]